jgi:predicted amidohydrolase YtcJ
MPASPSSTSVVGARHCRARSAQDFSRHRVGAAPFGFKGAGFDSSCRCRVRLLLALTQEGRRTFGVNRGLGASARRAVNFACHPDRSGRVFSCVRFVYAGPRGAGILAQFQILLAFAVIVFSLVPLSHAQEQPPTSTATVYKNAHIYTNNPSQPWAEVIVVQDGKILAIGPKSLISSYILERHASTIIDLHGAFVMPGFNDAHTHLGGAGAAMLSVRLNGAASIEELQKRLAVAVSAHQQGEWITGSGWDHTLWFERKFPNRAQLDAVSPNNPVILTHISGHVAVANSLALKLAGVDKNTSNPSGGQIERDASGDPTGMLEEGSAIDIVQRKVPDPTAEQRRHGIELVLADLAKNGVTSVQDNSDWQDFLLFDQLKSEGRLTVRITEWLPFSASLQDLLNMRAQASTTDPMLHTGALKGFTDGALGSRTAALLAPYSDDPSTSGILVTPPEELRKLAIERDKAGFQIAFHAIGDKANHVALDIFESVLKANGPRDRRDRIEHAQVVAPEDVPRFAKLNVIASMQPSHETSDMRWAESRLGPDRIHGAYAWNTMLKNNIHLAFGTDYPVEPISPFRGLYACVTRELSDGGPKNGWEPQEKITLEQCLNAYTTGSAYADFAENKKGQLKPGFYADFIILSEDLTKALPSQFTKIEVRQTFVAGHPVYQKR